MMVQAAIMAVPLVLIFSDPAAWLDPKLLVGAPLLAWLLAYSVTGAGTAFADWLRRRAYDVRKPKGEGVGSRGAGGRSGKLPQEPFRSRIGEDVR
jgi:hypothetical protein